ncbi:MAG: cytochrome P460 family protein [Spirochaetales bacterium]|nr:cytochrome P460 family protein [Spirochaetales bacterium]
MKPVCTLILPLFLTLSLFSGCSNKSPEPLMEALQSSDISGERLWERISEEAPYEDYSQWPGHEGLQPGQSPHGAWHRVYANKPLVDALPVADGTAPYGTIIVKENFTSSRELDKLTVMAKVEGYNPENNDWFWAMLSPEGEVLAEGSPGGCISCHSGMKYNDYIIIKNLDESLE